MGFGIELTNAAVERRTGLADHQTRPQDAKGQVLLPADRPHGRLGLRLGAGVVGATPEPPVDRGLAPDDLVPPS